MTTAQLFATKVAPPQGIEAVSQGGGWWYLTWHPVPGATGYEYSNEFGAAATTNTRSGIFAIPNGDKRSCKVRSRGEGDAVSGWMTATITVDGTGKLVKLQIEGDGGPPPPEPPAVPTVDRVTAGHESVAGWWTSTDVDQWEALLVDESGEQVDGLNTDQRSAIFGRLELNTRYGFKVRAVDTTTGLRSEWSPVRWVRTLADGERPKPDTPTGLRTHCVADTSAKGEWDTDNEIGHWLVWLEEDKAGALKTETPLVRLLKLKPDTEYLVSVVAVRDGVESDPARHTFKTRATILPPDEDPPPDIGGDLPAPKGLMVVAVDATTVDASWVDERPDGKPSSYYSATIDGRTWQRVDTNHIRFEGLAAHEAPWTVSVAGTFNKKLTGIARAAASPKGDSR